MKKLIIPLFFLIVLCSFAYSINYINSTNRSDYYHISGNMYFADGIENTDIAFNGNLAVNNTAIISYGYQEGNAKYLTRFYLKGNMSMVDNGAGDNAYILASYNTTWNGSFGFSIYMPNGTQGCGGKFNVGTGTALDLFYRTTINSTHWGYIQGGGGSGKCTENDIPVNFNRWTSLEWRRNSTGNINNYIDNILCYKWTGGAWGGIAGFSLSTSYFSGTYCAFDDMWASNTPLRPLQISSYTEDTIPTYANFTNNASLSNYYGGVINYSVSLSDDIGLSGYKFASNLSGVLTNYSFTSLSGLYQKVSYPLLISSRGKNNICGQFWFNDSIGQSNSTPLYCFNVYPLLTYYIFNNSFHRETPMNFNFTFDFSPINCTSYHNLTGNYTQIGSIQLGLTNITSCYNQTVYYNVSIPFIRLTAFYGFEEGSGSTSYDSVTPYVNFVNNGGYSYSTSKGGNGTGNYSINYDGVTGYSNGSYDFDKLSVKDKWTFTAWIYPTLTTSNRAIVSESMGYKNRYDFGIENNKLWFGYTTDLNSSQNTYSTVLNVTPNIWHLVGFTLNKISTNNIDFYMDGVLNSVYIARDIIAPASTGSLYFGRDVFAGGYYYQGKIDGVSFYNTTLNSTEWSQIYADAPFTQQTLSNITTICNTTQVNLTLNYSLMYGFNYTYDTDTVKDLSTYLVCYDTINTANSSLLYYRFDNDFTAPIINLTYPVPNNQTLGVDVFINATGLELYNCDINDSAFSLVYYNNTYFSFYETTLNNSFYSFVINCSDTSGNIAYKNVTFTKDKSYPYIFIYSILDGAVINSNVIAQPINATVVDNRDLYFINVTIYHFDAFLTRINEFNEYKLISGNQYDYFKLLNFRTISNGTNYLKVETCDSHTANNLKNANNVKKEKDALTYTFDDVIIKVKGITGLESSMDTTKFKDRYSFKTTYSKAQSKKSFELSSNKEIVPIEYSRSGYVGHFVIANKYWVDFETDTHDLADISKSANGTYLIDVNSQASSITFNSIGALNCISQTNIFTKSEVIPYSFLALNLSGTTLMILIFSLIILFLGLWLIAFFFTNFGFASFGFFIGLILGLILSSIHIFFTLLFMLMNIVIFIQFVRTKK